MNMSDETIQEMHRVLEMQKALNISEGAPDIKLRKDRLFLQVPRHNQELDIFARHSSFCLA